MDDMKEIVTVEQAEHALRLAAVALPLLGLAVGGAAGAVRRRPARGAAIGVLCGLVGPAVWALWRMYNGIVGSYGLDSVKGLMVNIALFVAIGLAAGVGIGLLCRKRSGQRLERRDSSLRSE